ncbi:UDP-N-acetylmuramoyl-L-alanyl-D-glutamate--2,6-diaminopimelate ligase [bacterium]|nr:UDP-N-acetylmuramoyl-L-alanyl-D-glutamate--2,6-diaminopimelate ligase [bacterium]
MKRQPDKTLAWLVQGTDIVVPGDGDRTVVHMTPDSREVISGSLYVAVRGFASDGHDYITQAVDKGASAVIASEPVQESRVPVFYSRDTRLALSVMMRRFHECPDESLIMMGVTGTNGKTTVSYLMESIMNAAGRSCGLLGTVAYRWPGTQQTASHTTPDAGHLFQILRSMADEGVQCVSMEVSSHALELHRVNGIRFRSAVFTNLTQDHLDFHPDFDAYASAKAKLFAQVAADGVGVINGDDGYAERMAGACTGKVVVFTEKTAREPAGCEALADTVYRIGRGEVSVSGSRFRLERDSEKLDFYTPLLGGFNVLNASAAAIAALETGVDKQTVQAGLERMARVPGRMEGFRSKRGFWTVVDYAHTPDALINALKTARAFTDGRLITVFGCGGDRDRGKRPLMGRAAAEISDRVIVTSDNPRTEDPRRIISDILEGIPASTDMRVIEDRESAIREAIVEAGQGDTVMVAGKGHEDYQILGREKIHFDDREVVQKYMNA